MTCQISQTQHRALKLRIYPTQEQATLISKTFGCCRQVYNTRLAERNTFYDTIIKPESDKAKQKELWKTAHFSTEVELKAKYEYMKEVEAQALQQSRMDAESAYVNFFKSLSGKRKGKKLGAPRFKSRKSYDFSYRTCAVANDCLDLKAKTVRLPKLGEVKFRHDGITNWYSVQGYEVKNATIRKNPAGQFYAVLLFAREYSRKPKAYSNEKDKSIGLDFSPADLYIDNEGKNGKDFCYIAQKQAHAKQLCKLGRRLSRKQKGSKNREKVRIKLARLENHIANSRTDFIEKETLRLVKTYEVIGIEDLNLIGIARFLSNAKNMTDTSWGTFVSKLEWKASKNENNCQIVKADRFFPSSKICSHCGAVYEGLKLSEREWTCKECGTHHVRDVNAAVNLRNNALNKVNVGRGTPELTSVENQQSGIEALALMALDGFNETENVAREGYKINSSNFCA